MILVTTGTNEQPFDRLVAAARDLVTDEARIIQYGSSRLPHGAGSWLEFVPFEELAQLMREARVVVCHAGVGSVMLARRSGKTPIVLPRRVHLGEAVDDHQLELARRLRDAGIVHLVENEADLAAAIAGPSQALTTSPTDMPGADALASAIRSTLEQLTGFVPALPGPLVPATSTFDGPSPS